MMEDALSMKEQETEGSLCAICISQSDWGKKQDQEVCNIIQELQEDPSTLDKFVWNNDLIWYHDRLYLCKNSQLKQKV